MTAIPALSRLRRASDDEILAERLEPPYTPLRWQGAPPYPVTVYGEVIDTDGHIYRTPDYSTPDPMILRWRAGMDYVSKGGHFTRGSAGIQRGQDRNSIEVGPNVLRDNQWTTNPVTGLLERAARLEPLGQNRVPDNTALHTWLTAHNSTPSATTLLGLPAVRIAGGEGASGYGAHRAADLVGSETTATYSLIVRVHPDIAALRLGGRVGITTANTLDVNLRTLTFTRLGSGIEAGRIQQIGPDTYYIEFRVTVTIGAARQFSVRFSDSSGTFDFPDATGLWIEVAGLQIEITPCASSTILTSGDPGTRDRDTFYFDLPESIRKPGAAMAIYSRCIVGADPVAISTPGIWGIVRENGGGERFVLYFSTAAHVTLDHVTNNGTRRATGPTVAAGDLLEALALTWTDSSAMLAGRLVVRVNGGPLASASLPLQAPPPAWGAPRLYVGSRGNAPGLYDYQAIHVRAGLLQGSDAEVMAYMSAWEDA